jgi:hypothetical protein
MSKTAPANREGAHQGRSVIPRYYPAPTLAKGPRLAAITANSNVSGLSDS